MYYQQSKFNGWPKKLITAAIVLFLMAMPFVLKLPSIPKKLVDVPSEPEPPKDTKPQWVETYVPKHKVQLPDFAGIRDVSEKKRRFFNFMMPYVEKENERLLAERIWLLEIRVKLEDNGVLNEEEQAHLARLNKAYRIKHKTISTLAAVKELLKCVDGLPKELVLMQAANESAWGSSRFARLGLNFFGQWCYSKGCGIVPKGRPEGKTYEVKAYMGVQQSVTSYFKNINTNPAYQLLRDIRAQLRANHLPLHPQVLATGLLAYSQRGDHYVQEISKMIEHNQAYMGD